MSRSVAYLELLDTDPTQVLVVSNEIASPLYSPTGGEGNYGSFTRRLAEQLAPHGIGVYAHERLGSADQHYNPDTAARLTPHNRPDTIPEEARRITADVVETFPKVQKIGLLGHSAGGVESVDLALAMHRDGDTRSLLGGVAISKLLVFDTPWHRHLSTAAGIARYLAYLPYEALLPTPPKSPEELAPATPGVLRRRITDARYNAAVWTRGVQPGLEAIARYLPQTAMHVVAAKHSPNNIAHHPGPSSYVARMNRLRDDMPGAARCDAEVYNGPHAGGSRLAVIMQLLARAKVLSM